MLPSTRCELCLLLQQNRAVSSVNTKSKMECRFEDSLPTGDCKEQEQIPRAAAGSDGRSVVWVSAR